MAKKNNKFDLINTWLNNVEGSAVNLASTVVPWLTPIAPMVMTFGHAVEIFGGGTWGIIWATPVAATVELLGFATVSTTLRFWMSNKKNRAKYKKAPTLIPASMFAFYLGLVLSTNVLLDLGPVVGISSDYVEIVVKALFTLQTIPGAVIVAVRATHRELLDGSLIVHPEPVVNAPEPKNEQPEQKKVRPSDYEQEILDYVRKVYADTGETPGPTEVAKALKLDPRSAKGYISGKIKTWEGNGKVTA